MSGNIAPPKTSQLGLFSSKTSLNKAIAQDASAADLQGVSGNETTTGTGAPTPETTGLMRTHQIRQLKPSKDSIQEKFERLLELAGQAFIASFQETLLEQLVLLLEKHPKLLQQVIKDQKLHKLGIDKNWNQTNKIIDLIYRLEKLGYKLRPELQPENNLVNLNNHLPAFKMR